jgi:hypothetical protein
MVVAAGRPRQARRLMFMKALFVSLLAGALGWSSAWAEEARAFDQQYALLGITFRVQAKDGSVTITPKGLSEDNRPAIHEIAGEITKVEVGDLNKDGSPEIYISIRQPGPEQRGVLLAYSANRKKSMSDVYLPELAETPDAFAGYTGRDEFALHEGRFVRRFPIPGGKTRELQYKLVAGEASWQLQLKKTTEN